MHNCAAIADVSLFACGNLSRGDDALAPLLLERLEQRFGAQAGLRFINDFQWQIEHAEDLRHCNLALFMDADVALTVPWKLETVHPQPPAYTTHALSPAALLAIYHQAYHALPPPAYVLRLRGQDFTLGNGLSAVGQASLVSAEAWLCHCLVNVDFLLTELTQKAQSAQKDAKT